MNTKSKVLLAEDDLSLGYVIKDNLADAGYEVVSMCRRTGSH